MVHFRRQRSPKPQLPIPHPTVTLGAISDGTGESLLTLFPAQVRTHWRIYGLSGFGKSFLLLSLLLQLLFQGEAFTLIDPHDLASGVLSALLQTGFFADARAYSRLLYINWADTTHVVPFNILKQPYEPHTIAQNIASVFHRTWPSTDKGNAPLFDTILLSSLVVLIYNQLPITALMRLITDTSWREQLLNRCPDREVVSFFRDRFVHWGKGVMIESTARRLQLLTFNPVLRQSLGATENPLDPRGLMDAGTSVIHDLGGLDAATQRFIGGLLFSGYEQAALSRADIPEGARRPHHLFLEEFSMFTDCSEEALERMLALVRKYGLYTVLCNQTNSQLGRALHGALGNIGVEVAFRLNPDDAREAAPRFTRYDPQRLTYHSPTSSGSYASRAEQVQETIAALESLPKRHALVRVDDRIVAMEPLTVSGTAYHQGLETLKQRYAQQFTKTMESNEHTHSPDTTGESIGDITTERGRREQIT
jgi:hypothetical protein